MKLKMKLVQYSGHNNSTITILFTIAMITMTARTGSKVMKTTIALAIAAPKVGGMKSGMIMMFKL